MTNKEIKVGDQIYEYTPYGDVHGRDVAKVKKSGTLVTVVAKLVLYDGRSKEMTLYGHASSSMLSGYERSTFNDGKTVFTCDLKSLQRLKLLEERRKSLRTAGLLLEELKEYLNGK